MKRGEFQYSGKEVVKDDNLNVAVGQAESAGALEYERLGPRGRKQRNSSLAPEEISGLRGGA